MSAVTTNPLLLLRPVPKFNVICKKSLPFVLNCTQTSNRRVVSSSRHLKPPEAVSSAGAVVETSESSVVTFSDTLKLKRSEKIEGKVTIKLENGENEQWQLIVGCSLPGKWVLHWGVHYIGDIGSEWDHPPLEMRPPGSIPIKDCAIETPFEEGKPLNEVKIDFNTKSSIAAINFVLKDEENGYWIQHKRTDFEVPLVNDGSDLGAQKRPIQGFYEEHSVYKETCFDNIVNVSVKHYPEKAKNLLYIETDLPGDVVIHWGVCRDEGKNWEVPNGPYPPETTMFKNKALRTRLQLKDDGQGSSGSFTLDEAFSAFVFVLKLNETWLNCNGNDFYIPFSRSKVVIKPENTDLNEAASEYTDEIINEIRNLVRGISSEKSRSTKSKEAQETILHEIEKLAAEAYSIFRASTPSFIDTSLLEYEKLQLDPPVKIISGTGAGYEVLCQGFNWESHKSGKWYLELHEKVSKLAELGFTVIWLPPPTDSVSPEGYMPRDLYNLNSRYGNMDQLKNLVKKLHAVGIRVLGDAVLNHRCAQYQNHNGVWNIFGGKLNWDDRAVVADDPHFQGRGNKSSGECFHAAPNIDHSQEFVRNDIKEWLRWLREEIGYDGWRLDFVRGFWGGYVKDYLESSEPYFTVGEFWDSLNYTYGEMDHNQDAHRQRIVDWINATNGMAGAFDVTTKGILHGALERCEYWRLSDQKGKPPGVVGWWASRAVTFIENHDTGSTQGHWRFPGGKEMQGYAYILTHPGTPSVFYDHIFSHYQSQIATLISIRKRNKIHSRSTVKIVKAERDVYAAIIDEKLAMKIGPGHYEPSNGGQGWSLATQGKDYKVWEISS